MSVQDDIMQTLYEDLDGTGTETNFKDNSPQNNNKQMDNDMIPSNSSLSKTEEPTSTKPAQQSNLEKKKMEQMESRRRNLERIKALDIIKKKSKQLSSSTSPLKDVSPPSTHSMLDSHANVLPVESNLANSSTSVTESAPPSSVTSTNASTISPSSKTLRSEISIPNKNNHAHDNSSNINEKKRDHRNNRATYRTEKPSSDFRDKGPHNSFHDNQSYQRHNGYSKNRESRPHPYSYPSSSSSSSYSSSYYPPPPPHTSSYHSSRSSSSSYQQKPLDWNHSSTDHHQYYSISSPSRNESSYNTMYESNIDRSATYQQANEFALEQSSSFINGYNSSSSTQPSEGAMIQPTPFVMTPAIDQQLRNMLHNNNLKTNATITESSQDRTNATYDHKTCDCRSRAIKLAINGVVHEVSFVTLDKFKTLRNMLKAYSCEEIKQHSFTLHVQRNAQYLMMALDSGASNTLLRPTEEYTAYRIYDELLWLGAERASLWKILSLKEQRAVEVPRFSLSRAELERASSSKCHFFITSNLTELNFKNCVAIEIEFHNPSTYLFTLEASLYDSSSELLSSPECQFQKFEVVKTVISNDIAHGKNHGISNFRFKYHFNEIKNKRETAMERNNLSRSQVSQEHVLIIKLIPISNPVREVYLNTFDPTATSIKEILDIRKNGTNQLTENTIISDLPDYLDNRNLQFYVHIYPIR